jgi:hypothetical protein
MAISLLGTGTHRAGSPGSSNSVTYNGTAGSGLIVFVSMAAAVTNMTVTDTNGNTYTNILAQTNGGGGNAYIAVFYAQGNLASGNNTITANWTTNTGSVLTVAEYTGLGFFHKTSAAQHATSTTYSTNSATPAVTGELGISLVSTNTALQVTFSAPTNGFTQEFQTNASPCFAFSDLVISGTPSTSSSGTISNSIGWTSVLLLFYPFGTILNQDGAVNSITGNGPGTVAANNACAPGDLLVCEFSLSNVSSGNSGFVPVISDNVNTGNWNVQYTTWVAGSPNQLKGFAWIVANATGTPTVTLGSSVVYNNGFLNYLRFNGFSETPALDGLVQASTNTGTAVTGSFTSTGTNELVLGMTFGGGSYSSPPAGFNKVNNVSQGDIVSPYWLENTSGQSNSFSGTLNASTTWTLVLAGFSSGAVAPAIGALIQVVGPGVSPDKRSMFFARQLSASTPAVLNFGTGYSASYGYGKLLPIPAIVGIGYSSSYGYGLMTLLGTPGQYLNRNGPGVSADWPMTFFNRPLSNSKNFTPAGQITGYGYSASYGYGNAQPLPGASSGIGYSASYGYGNIGAILASQGFGYSSAYGFGNPFNAANPQGMGYSASYGFGQLVSGTFPMPNVIGLLQSAAQNILQALNLIVNVGAVYSTITPPGYVSQQTPQPGVFVFPGETVTIFVSLGQFVRAPNPSLGYRVSQRTFSLEEMVSREWGPNFRAPDHRIYEFSNGRAFDSTDLGNTGIYQKGTSSS